MTENLPGLAPSEQALFTDLYELNMLRAYMEAGMDGEATFSLFVRKLPERRNFLLACGLAQVLDYLETLHFSEAARDWLAAQPQFPRAFADRLADFRFTGSVRAVPEGTPVFAGEPILEITAPIGEAQVVETYVMNQVQLQTMLASKAHRVVAAAAGRPLVDFGARRMHGTDAAMKAARALYIAGIGATSNVLAAKSLGMPASGTMAHSYIEAFDDELDAFRHFAATFPDTVLLVDTYDTLQGVRKVVRLAEELGEAFRVRAVRLDSGDLGALAQESRRILDEAGLRRVGIFASGGLDEDRIAALVRDGAPVDGFGVGTDLGVSGDAPHLDIAYKLTAYRGRGRMKLSTGKRSLPGPKQVFRDERDGTARDDVIARSHERLPGRPLLVTVMENGRRTPEGGEPPLDRIRAHAAAEIARLPEPVRSLVPAEPPYPVRISDELAAYEAEVSAALRRR